MTYKIGYLLICDRYPYSSVCFWFFQPPNIESVSGATPAVLVATVENQENNSVINSYLQLCIRLVPTNVCIRMWLYMYCHSDWHC